MDFKTVSASVIAWCSRYRLSHFVAPLYVDPSQTPGNATPTSEFEIFDLNVFFKNVINEICKGKTSNPYRLSHFVAPLFGAPSTTPSNAKPTSE